MEIKAALQHVSVFAKLNDQSLAGLAEHSEVRGYETGDFILTERAKGSSLVVLLSGRVGVQRQTGTGRTVLITLRKAGDHLGEMSLLDGQGHSADVVALEYCLVVLVPREAFLEVLHQNTDVAVEVIKALTARLREQTGDLTRAKSLDVMGRVCSALVELADGKGEIRGVTQQHLANQTGATRESVNRTLQLLKEAGHIEQDRGFIRVLHARALRERAEDFG
ncbi:Crp/Fnr family transcriptional regulator [Fimbriimonas ginsengisoli]|uniref:Regulatory subunit of cAMP-dependent protein kinase n=1 Tax=Fimbriimonas ginsengisoli Gsoil 348 TaxID=661478 RepID=A0A068NTF3_FIMGI|nr:Crp/Fnr family transcriptional regulator [Fimbriimonas ginsengisoli]AIE86035.1 regulatory subunit of cAMP-dependent protein kinase [Fimbriimonas ginsengisoli Gsoil 348]